jgi:hypothetical protein
MKNIKGFIIIGLSIIIGSLIISLTIFNKNYSAKDISAKEHCYKKNYTDKLQDAKNRNKKFNFKYTDEHMEANAAIKAIYNCELN